MLDHFEALRKDFVIDTLPLVSTAESLLLEIEKGLGTRAASEREIGELMRHLHTIKGNAGMMGMTDIQSQAHQLEDLVKALTAGGGVPDQLSIDVLLEGLSVMENAIRAVLEPQEQPSPSVSSPPPLEAKVPEPQPQTFQPPALPAEPEAPHHHEANQFRPRALADAIRIDFKKLDHLLSLVGELVIFQTALNRTVGAFRASMPSEEWRRLEKTTESLSKTVAEVQEAVMQTRLLPVSTVFGKFPRMIRDLAKAQGKQIDVVLEGAETDIDKTVLDAIADPLLHLVRNSVDHGLEPPNERVSKGKSPQGRIVLAAASVGKQIRIQVMDDGRGINPEKVAAKAKSMGVDISGMDQRQLLDLIFLPGFSTAASVTEISGRGVGLSVVRDNIEKLRGQMMVSSVPGQGACFSLLVPLTLAIIDALIVEIGSEQFALPVSSVIETVRLQRRDLHRIGGVTVLKWREQAIPILDLGDRFGLAQPALESAAFVVAVLGASGRLVMVPVSKLLGREELVIQGLDESLGATPGIAGATILDTGQVLLVLDFASLAPPGASRPAPNRLSART